VHGTYTHWPHVGIFFLKIQNLYIGDKTYKHLHRIKKSENLFG
jgi:hypothetical protein